jgi:hypothetical protein
LATIAQEVGVQEIGLLVGLALVAVGGWAIHPPLG